MIPVRTDAKGRTSTHATSERVSVNNSNKNDLKVSYLVLNLYSILNFVCGCKK